MATNYAILGQSAPANTNNADLFTVVTAHDYVVSTIVVANTSTSAATYRVFARKAGAAAGASNAIVYDSTIAANSSVTLTLGVTLDGTAGDVLTVRSGTANALTFTAFGSDIS
jgi:hypothetical protein